MSSVKTHWRTTKNHEEGKLNVRVTKRGGGYTDKKVTSQSQGTRNQIQEAAVTLRAETHVPGKAVSGLGCRLVEEDTAMLCWMADKLLALSSWHSLGSHPLRCQ